MNPTDLKFNIMPIIVMGLGLIAALFLGVFIGGSDVLSLIIIFVSVGVIALVSSMRQYIWLLLPMFWGFVGFVQFLPIQFAVRDLVVMLVGTVSFALFALRVFRFHNRWDFLDWMLLLNLAQVAIAFISNPAGLKSLSSQTVGARPYFNIAIATLAYFIVSNQIVSLKLARRLPVFVVIAELVSSMFYLLGRTNKSLGYALAVLYSGWVPPIYLSKLVPDVERVTGVVSGGSSLITALCSYFRPLTLISPFRPARFILFIIGIILILISGFRSELLTVVVIFLLASYFRHGWSDVFVSLAGLFLGALFLILFNSFVHPLPLSMQRTLSALPGHWDSRAVKDATGSTEWRLQMWRDIPKGTKYIRNRVMGDGFGFSQAELQAMERQRLVSGDIQQEDFMIIGSFHSGPLSAIRFVGIVGLVLYYTLLIYSAVYAWRLIRITQGTDISPLALFVGLAIIWEPVNYTLIFGAFDSGLPNALFNAGMLKMIHNSIPQSATTAEQVVKPTLRPNLLEGSRVGTV